MIRYRLDDLLAYQFEKLVQALLKASISLDVESWGNRTDFGRDAYTPHPLWFPDPKRTSKGPFLFQVKFVENANAAGARPTRALLSSADKEIVSINKRKQQGTWKSPRHFTFITNAPLQAGVRDQLRTKFLSAVGSGFVHLWGGDDICDLLDSHYQIARSFPQLLSIRDLDSLIRRALSTTSIERSSSAVQIARELVEVFAPTSSYARAWKVAQRYHFVVLEGPPEVGKSAIAWMIGLTQVGAGWEAIVCRTPDTFFEMLNRDRPQVFIADDAFGRTEYDPTRTTRWEADLDHILHRVDREHWLIWTSRKHILERAVERMDAEGKARSFPDPAAVIVDTDTLSVEERALILFRHARAAGLESDAKSLVRRYAKQIVFDKEFTPERMRRFISESLPDLINKLGAEKLNKAEIAAAITEALRNPTKQMRLAFRQLPAAYKWFLVALLQISEVEARWASEGNIAKLRDLYDSYCPEVVHEPADTVLTHLTEAFIKVRSLMLGRSRDQVDWIHPSYRDLVIDELVDNAELRNTFLRRASLEGIKLTVSDTGGREGQRKMPFLRSAESWDILLERCVALVEPSNSADLLRVLSAGAEDSTTPHLKARWQHLMTEVCKVVAHAWDSSRYVLQASELRAFVKAGSAAHPVGMPIVIHSWEQLVEQFQEGLKHAERFGEFDFDLLGNMTRFADVVEGFAPEFLSEVGYPEKYELQMTAVLEEARFELGIEPEDEESRSYRKLSERLSSIAGVVERLTVSSSDKISEMAVELVEKLEIRSGELDNTANELEPREGDEYDGGGGGSTGSETFDIDNLFTEL